MEQILERMSDAKFNNPAASGGELNPKVIKGTASLTNTLN
jgi:hypothetical protein